MGLYISKLSPNTTIPLLENRKSCNCNYKFVFHLAYYKGVLTPKFHFSILFIRTLTGCMHTFDVPGISLHSETLVTRYVIQDNFRYLNRGPKKD